ncbi:MAG: class I adenylate-forming enzyme family protein [Geodermatophilaceae bacterium]
MTVAAGLAARVAANPDACAVSIDDRRWTAAGLAATVATAAGWLAPQLTGEPRRVAVCVADPADQLLWTLAAHRIGAAAAVLDVRWPPEQQTAALEQISPGLIVRHPVASVAPSGIAVRCTDAAAESLGWISLTSGTTGAPRALGRSWASWTASFPAFTQLTGLTADDTVLVPGSLSSSMFAYGAFHALAAGARVRLLAGWQPESADDPEVTVAHLVPTMLADLLDAGRSDFRPRVVVTAGAKLSADLERRVRAAWPGTLIVEYYGSSEQSFVTARTGADPATVGRPFPGVQVEVRDDTGHRAPAGGPGVIWTRSPYAAEDYLDGAAGRFRQVGGWVSVGDRGWLDGTGALSLLGREQITTGGTTVDPAPVESVLRAAPGVRDVVVVGLPHPRLGEVVAAAVECRLDCRLSSLRLYARAHLAAAQRPRRWYAVAQLPRTGGGKPARADLVAAIQQGRLLPLS